MNVLQVLALLVLLLSTTSNAAAQTPTPLASSIITGPGVDELKVTGEPDVNGLIWNLYLPTEKHDNLGIVVVNANNQTLYGINFVAEFRKGSEWERIWLSDEPRYIQPMQLAPGEFGVLVVSWVEFGYGEDPAEWEEVRVSQVDFELEAPASGRVDTPIEAFSHADYEVLSGSISNLSGVPGRTPSVYLGCVVNGKLTDLTLVFVHDADTKIGPGETMQFEIYIDPAGTGFPCEPSDSHIVWGVILPDD